MEAVAATFSSTPGLSTRETGFQDCQRSMPLVDMERTRDMVAREESSCLMEPWSLSELTYMEDWEAITIRASLVQMAHQEHCTGRRMTTCTLTTTAIRLIKQSYYS